MQLVTGYTGTPHVSAQDDSIRNVMLGEYGGRGVFPVLNQFEATAVTANEVRVQSGYGINQGRLFKIDRNSYDALTIENGTAGSKRADLIVARYARDEQTGIESCELVVIKGTAGSTYVDPTYTTGDILQGALQDDMPMYRVKINGIVIEEVEPLFTTYRSLIGGIEPIVSEQVDADFNSKLSTYQARFDEMTAQDHAAYSQMMNDDDSAFDTWFASIQSLIDEQTATRLANAIAKHDTNFASVEASTTASKAYAVGDLLVYQNNLYKVTSAIASGGTINTASGGNVGKCSIADVIDDIEGYIVTLNQKTNGMVNGYVAVGKDPDTILGAGATAEGYGVEAFGDNAHAEGYLTKSQGWSSHSEGRETIAGGEGAHAEGYLTRAYGSRNGYGTHAEGCGTIAWNGQHASGKYNEEDEPDINGNTDYAFIVGNGSDDNNRSNAMTVDWQGHLRAVSYTNFSSRKYKKNIKDMTEEEAKKLLELNPVSYDYKSEMLPDGQFGLIAEDVEPIMTYPLVYKNDEVDSIDYSKFVPALIKMVQIQQKEIDSLKEALKK